MNSNFETIASRVATAVACLTFAAGAAQAGPLRVTDELAQGRFPRLEHDRSGGGGGPIGHTDQNPVPGLTGPGATRPFGGSQQNGPDDPRKHDPPDPYEDEQAIMIGSDVPSTPLVMREIFDELLRRLPRTSGGDFVASSFSEIGPELVIIDADAYERIAPTSFVRTPSPGTGVLLVVAGLLTTARRRRV